MSALEQLRHAFDVPGPRPPLRVLAASGQLGYGIPEAALDAGLERRPHVIGADMGSIDPGPAYLGSGRMATTPALSKRDLALVLEGARRLEVPLLIGSAGTAGTQAQLDEVVHLVREIAHQGGLRFKLATIQADMPRERIIRAVAGGKVKPIGAIEALDRGTVDAAANVVGQMGLEAFARALESGADVVVAGRACDTAPFAVVPALLGFPLGLAMHLAKIIECTSLCCEPGGRDAMLATLDDEGFVLESMNPERAATPLSVAAHALYEQADPYRVAEPEGVLHLDGARYEAVDERRVRVSGARWQAAPLPSVKIEGAERRREARAIRSEQQARADQLEDMAELAEIDRIQRIGRRNRRHRNAGIHGAELQQAILDSVVEEDHHRAVFAQAARQQALRDGAHAPERLAVGQLAPALLMAALGQEASFGCARRPLAEIVANIRGMRLERDRRAQDEAAAGQMLGLDAGRSEFQAGARWWIAAGRQGLSDRRHAAPRPSPCRPLRSR